MTHATTPSKLPMSSYKYLAVTFILLQAGKLDLTEVEGLADLLAAETEAQRVQVSHLLVSCVLAYVVACACAHACVVTYRATLGPNECKLQSICSHPELLLHHLFRCTPL